MPGKTAESLETRDKIPRGDSVSIGSPYNWSQEELAVFHKRI